ncbi:hypothetical protein [Foetidibacter luteolus]|uniref:hypothetical protein n=1 Tax=Foetidibacter luteolus TaxID=2608880 RepID=UPI00129B6BA7|nr:hypothetical protein [Foetidibacter luteolus]
MSLYQCQQEIDALMQGFNNKTLPKEQWTHQAHLTAAVWHLKHYDINEATCLLKSGIISYNLSVGGVNNGFGGYHETLTIFWISIVDFYVRRYNNLSVTETCNNFLESNLADRALPFKFYAKEYILSPAARARFMQPDILPLSDENILSVLNRPQQ